EAVQVVDRARAALAEVPSVDVPTRPDEDACEAARAGAEQIARELAEVDGRVKAAGEELRRARELVERADALSGEGDCPLCGQALGDAFEQVQHHRADELARAEASVKDFTAQQKTLSKASTAATKEAEKRANELRVAQKAWTAYERALERRTTAEKALADALAG